MSDKPVYGNIEHEMAWHDLIEMLRRKDELLREAASYLQDAVDAMDEGDDEEGEFDNEYDLIARIRKEVGE